MRQWIWRAIVGGLLGIPVCPAMVDAQQPGASQPASPDQQAELAKKLANPISDLVSVPFQFNWSRTSDRTTRPDSCSTSSRSFRSPSARTGT